MKKNLLKKIEKIIEEIQKQLNTTYGQLQTKINALYEELNTQIDDLYAFIIRVDEKNWDATVQLYGDMDLRDKLHGKDKDKGKQDPDYPYHS